MTTPSDIFSISSSKQFEKIALKVFRFQYDNNAVYREFCRHLKVEKQNVKSLIQIPFLPIQFFKSHKVVSGNHPLQAEFTSSGTTGMTTSSHWIADLSVYESSYRQAFHNFTAISKITWYWLYFRLI